MSALDRLIEEVERTLGDRKPGVIDTENHKNLILQLEKLEKYEKLYIHALENVRHSMNLVKTARDDDVSLVKVLTQPKATQKTLAERLKEAGTSSPIFTPAPTPSIAAAQTLSSPTVSSPTVSSPTVSSPTVSSPTVSSPLNLSSAPSVFMQTTTVRNRELATTQNGLHSRPQRINISPSVNLDAIVVTSGDSVRQDGYLYYVSSWDHFAIRVNGHLFHGNIGIIYDKPTDSSKTADCRYPNCKHRSTCPYYHDPSRFMGSSERRNYYNAALTYSPSDCPRGKNMHFGSLSNIETDASHIDLSAANALRDHAMHDMLCAMIALDRAQKITTA